MIYDNVIYQALAMSPMIAPLLGAGDACRAFPDGVIEQGEQMPAVTWQLLTGGPENTFDPIPVTDHFLVQVDTYAMTKTEAGNVADAVRAVLQNFGHCIRFGMRAFEPDTRRHRESKDYSFWLPAPGTEGELGGMYINPSGDVLAFPAGATINARCAVAIRNGLVFLADPSNPDDASQVQGISLSAGDVGDMIPYRISGTMSGPWAWTPGPIFYTTAGVLTQVLSDDVVCEVARASDATNILVGVKSPG